MALFFNDPQDRDIADSPPFLNLIGENDTIVTSYSNNTDNFMG